MIQFKHMDKQIDFLAIGDIVAEPFIKITDAEANCDLQGEHCKICFRFGEKIPYESALVCYAVGNSPNVAVGVSRLGVKSSLVSYIGDDITGKQNLASLFSENVNVDYVKTISGLESNFHYVLWYETERTILVKHTEFPYSLDSNLPEAKWVYLSSLASNSTEYHNEIINYLKKFPNTKLAFQPGTFQIKLGVEALKEIYERTEILFCNISEAQIILKSTEEDRATLMKMLQALGPKNIVMTDGINGSYALEGTELWSIPIYEASSFESTGAGDAFASGMMAALLLDKNIEEALTWGPVNAMSVVSEVGPQKGLLTKEQLEDYLAKASEDYKVTKIKQ